MTSKEYLKSFFPHLSGEIVLLLFLICALVILGTIFWFLSRKIFPGPKEEEMSKPTTDEEEPDLQFKVVRNLDVKVEGERTKEDPNNFRVIALNAEDETASDQGQNGTLENSRPSSVSTDS